MRQDDLLKKYLPKIVVLIALLGVPFIVWQISLAGWEEAYYPNALVDNSNTLYGQSNPASGDYTSAKALRQIGGELYNMQSKVGTFDSTAPGGGKVLTSYYVGGSRWAYPTTSPEVKTATFTVTPEEAYAGKTFHNLGWADNANLEMELPPAQLGMKVTLLVATGGTTFDIKVEIDEAADEETIIGVVSGLDAGDTIDLDTPATGEFISCQAIDASTWWCISNGVWLDGGAN